MTNIGDFIKYYPNVLSREVCSLTVEKLSNIIATELVAGSTRINGIQCESLTIDSDNMTFPFLANAITKIKDLYISEYPRYQRFIKFCSGESFGVFEDVGNKLLIQHYLEDGYMSEHIDNTGQRTYIREHKTINLEHKHAQLSIIIMLNDDYDGGEFVVADKEIKPKKGSSIIFPSNFMYPHEAKPVTKGTRYSVVAWLM